MNWILSAHPSFDGALGCPDMKDDAQPVKDLLDFSEMFEENRAHIVNSALLSPATILIIEQIGIICASFCFARKSQAPGFLDEVDVIEFANRKPTSGRAQVALAFSDTCCKMRSWSKTIGLWSRIGAEQVESFFGTWVPQLAAHAAAVLHQLQNKVINSEFGKKFASKPEGGWPEADHEKILAQMEDLHSRLSVFELKGKDEDQCVQLKQLDEWIKELQKTADITLTAAERALKGELTLAMNELVATFPTWSLDQLMNASLPDLQAEVGPRKNIAKLAAPFLAKVSSCTEPGAELTLSQLGGALESQVNDTIQYAKAVLGCQSAFQILKTNDAEKAAKFEEQRLQPRGLTMDMLPSSVQNAVVALSKQ